MRVYVCTHTCMLFGLQYSSLTYHSLLQSSCTDLILIKYCNISPVELHFLLLPLCYYYNIYYGYIYYKPNNKVIYLLPWTNLWFSKKIREKLCSLLYLPTHLLFPMFFFPSHRSKLLSSIISFSIFWKAGLLATIYLIFVYPQIFLFHLHLWRLV